jgi:tetratricopeptide (TPR) repeat protein
MVLYRRSWIFLLAVTMFASHRQSLPAAEALSSQELVAKGNALLKAGNPGAAVDAFSEALRIDPKNADAYQFRAVAFGVSGRHKDAIADFKEAIRLVPPEAKSRLAELHACCSISHRGLRDLASAERECNVAISLDHESPRALTVRGLLAIAKKEYDSALADANEAIRLDANCGQAYLIRGQIHFIKKDYDHAIGDFGEVIRICPGQIDGYFERASALIFRDRIDEAIADLSTAIRINPRLEFLWGKRAGAYVRKRDFKNVIADLTEELRLNPNHPLAHSFRGAAHLGCHEYAEAIADFTVAIQQDPKDGLSFQDRGEAYLALGKWDEAIADYSEAIHLDPSAGRTYFNRGVAYDRLGDYVRRNADFAQAEQLDPEIAALVRQYRHPSENAVSTDLTRRFMPIDSSNLPQLPDDRGDLKSGASTGLLFVQIFIAACLVIPTMAVAWAVWRRTRSTRMTRDENSDLKSASGGNQ